MVHHKNITNNNKKPPPRKIIHENKVITSLKKICNIANCHYIQKIVNIRNKFTPSVVSPIDILKKIQARPKNKFKLPLITIEETKTIIKKLKSSNSTGHDLATTKIYKKLANRISPHITHLINSIITTSSYPNILKVSKMTPILKPDKDPLLVDSYRPINNLCTLEKIVEEHIKTHLSNHLEVNKIIDKNHHGSRKLHGTSTAITHITHELNNRYEDDYLTAIVQTDLSSAFDTIDSDRLLQKLNYYGVEDKELKLFNSFMTDRSQYVTLDTYQSDVKYPLDAV